MVFGHSSKGRKTRSAKKESSKKNASSTAVPVPQNPTMIPDITISQSPPAISQSPPMISQMQVATSQSPPITYAHSPWSTYPPQQPVYQGPTPQPYPTYDSKPYIGHSSVSLVSTQSHPQNESKWKSPLNAVHLASKSVTNLGNTLNSKASKSTLCLNRGAEKITTKTSNCVDNSTSYITSKSTQALNQGAALCDLITSKFDAVITSMDGEKFSGDENELVVYPSPNDDSTLDLPAQTSRALNLVYPSAGGPKGKNHFSKVWLYANSRLPPHLPPLKVYIPTYPLLCLAAQYSERAYAKPRGTEREAHVDASIRSGTKAMVLKSIPVDDMNTVVFAIRGSQTFMDWAVNFRPAPSSPEGFLDDPGNLCHTGFLYVARQMVVPVAERLRNLLQENPSRSNCSLLITGHSAGGAVAALLYAHMMSTSIQSELNYLTGFFKRVHCVTFGAPPVTLLPLKKPESQRHRKSLFFSFINEGDPVPRADKTVIRSLLKLYTSPVPNGNLKSISTLNLASTVSVPTILSNQSKPSKPSNKKSKSTPSANSTLSSQPVWPIPPSTLSIAGRPIVLRKRPGSTARNEDDIEAVVVDDEMLREAVFGDPMAHMMRVYARRIEVLATKAVTVQGY